MYTIEQLKEERMSKEELFDGSNFSFDYSMPQDWLNDFSDWCKKYQPEISYDLIHSTTVWAYTGKHYYGFPVFECIEVYITYLQYLVNK